MDLTLVAAVHENLLVQRDMLDRQIERVSRLLKSEGAALAAPESKPRKVKGRRLLSAGARKRIAAAQRRRWKAVRAAKKQAS